MTALEGLSGAVIVKRRFTQIRAIEKALALARIEYEDSGLWGRGNSGYLVSDPVGEQAIKSLEEIKAVVLNDGTLIKDPGEWVAVFKATRSYFKHTPADQIIVCRYLERKSVERTLLEIGYLSRKTFFTLQDQVVYFALGVAEGLGLLNKKGGF